jgi:hypothetical protein
MQPSQLMFMLNDTLTFGYTRIYQALQAPQHKQLLFEQ